MAENWGENDKPVSQTTSGGDWGAGDKPVQADPPARGLKGWGQDIAASAVKGAIGVPEMLVGLADIPTGGRVGKFLANESGDFGFRPKEAKEIVNDWHSDATKEAQRKFGEAKGIWDKAKTAIENPSVIANSVGESLFLMGSGSLAARGLMALGARGVAGAAGGVGPALPGALARTVGAEAAPIAAGAIGEGVTMAGSAAEQYRQETKDGLLTPEQSGFALATGVAGAGFATLGGKLAHKFGFGDADTMLAQGARGVAREAEESAAARTGAAALQRTALSNIPKKVIQGAISEGFFEELPQSVAEQIFQNMALDKPWDTDLDSASVMGVLAGAAMGGPASGVHAYGQYRNGNAPQPPGQQQGQPPGTQPNNSAPPVNPGLERVRQAFLEQLQALQAQEQGEPTVPQVEPPNGAAILAQRQAENRAITSPDDEIYQSTGYNEYAQRQSEIANQPPELNPSLERARQGLTNQLEHLQTQEEGEPAVPQAAPPDGALVLARQQAQQQAARDAVNQVNRAVTSPDDEIYQSTGRGFTPSQRMGINPKAGPLSAGAAIALDTGVSTPIQQGAATPTSLRSQSGDEAGSVWSQMPTAQRMELAQRVDLKPIIKNNLHSAQWEGINPEIQSKLAQAMQTQGGLATTSELAQSQPIPESTLTRAPDIATGPARVLQNRDRSTAASIGQMNDIASAPDYLRAGQARVMDSGAPVVFGAAPSSALMGKQQQIADGHGARVPVQYAVVEAADVLPSHQADGTPIAQYQQGVPGQLRAVAGNGRAAGITEAYRRGTTTQYRQDLIDDASDLGVDPKAISAMSAPMLVRVMPEEHVTDDIGDRSNISGTAALSATEQAANDTKRLDMSALSFDEAGMPDRQSIAQFVNAMPVGERGAMMQPDGSPTRQLVDRITSAAFKSAYGNDELVTLQAQSTDPEVRNIITALASVAGPMAGLEGAGDLDIRGAVSEAAQMAVNAKRLGVPLADYLNNADMGFSGEAFVVAKFMADNIRSAKRMAEGLRAWVNYVAEQVAVARDNQTQDGFFGATPTASRNDVFNQLGATNEQANTSSTSLQNGASGPSRVTNSPQRQDTQSSPEPSRPADSQQELAQQEVAPKVEASKQPLDQAENNPEKQVEVSKDEAAAAPAKPEPVKSETTSSNSQDTGFLASPTAEQVVAQQDQAAAAAKAETAQRRAQDERDRLERERKDIAKASEAAADTFELGGDAEQNLSGQRDIFGEAPESIKSEPADKPAPTNFKEGIAKVRAEKKTEADQQKAPKAETAIPDSALLRPEAPSQKQDAPKFSRTDTPAPPARGVSSKAHVAMFNRLADSIAAHWANAPKIVVATNMDDPAIPESARQSDAKQQSNGASGHVEGFWHEGMVYLLTDNLQSATDAVRVLLHESLGHHGLRGVFGPKLDAILSKVIELRRDDVVAKAEQYGLDPSDEADLKEAAEEVLATMAQETPKLPLVRRAIAAIRSWLRDHVPTMGSLALTDDEIIRSYILPARAFVERGQQNGSRLQSASPFSRNPSTQAAYEARIDALFAGASANRVGARILDRSDVLGMLGFDQKPMVLQESKVVASKKNHPAMLAEYWKRIPQWLENPAAVFDSDTERGSGRLVFVAPEDVNGAPVVMIVEPDAVANGNHMSVSLLVNAYDKDGGMPIHRWMRDGLLRYADKKAFPAIFTQSVGRQLSDTALQNKPRMKSILTEKHLAGYRRASPDIRFSRVSQTGNAAPTGTPTDRAVINMAREGKSAQEILKLITNTSRNRFNKQVARLLLKTGTNPTVNMVDGLGGGKGFKFLAKYHRPSYTVSMTDGAQGMAEQIFLHEMIHAATLRSLDRKGLASVQMHKLYEHVKKQGGASGRYGMKNVGEFVAEAFTNPEFQQALKAMSAPTASPLKSAWDSLVQILRHILGLPSTMLGANSVESALSRTLDLGISAMREDMALRQRGVGTWRGSAAFASQQDDAHFDAFDLTHLKESTHSLTRHWANAPEVVVLSGMNDAHVPQAVRDEDARQRSQGATGSPEGFVHEGVVYLVADQLATAADVKRVLMHETLGHIGLRGVFGDGLNQVLNQVILGRRADVSAKAAQYGLDMNDPAQRLDAAEEVLAEMAQANPQLGFVKRAVSAIRNWLRAHGFSRLKLTDSDIVQAYILPARGWVERGGGAGAVRSTAFSRSTIVGQTTRVYSADVLAAMQNTGMQVEVPTLQERAKALWKDAGKKLTQGIVDQFSPVKDLSKDAYRLLRMSKGASGAFEALMHGGRLKLTDGVYDIDRAQRGGVVEKLFKPMQGEHHDFLRWVAANRAERLLGDGREHLFTQADIDALKTLADGTLHHAYTLKNGPRAGQTTTDRSEMYRDSLVTFNEFNTNALDMAEQSGLINADGRKDWESEFYVPFYRAMQEDGSGVVGGNIKSGVVRQQAFKHLKGGTDKLNADLLDNTLMNWAHLLDAGAKNRAALATLEAAQGMGVAIEASADVARDIGKATHNRDGVVWATDEGVQRYFVVDDPYILTALTSLEYAGMRNPVMNAMGTMKRVLTIGVTASPFFKVRNLIRDSVQAIGLGDMSYNIGSNLKEGWKLTDPKSDAYFSLLASGGTIHFGSMYEGNESKRIQALVESGIDRDTILNDPYRVKEFYRKTLEPLVTAYNEVGNRGEAINRAALYDHLVKKGVSHAEAALQARDLMDFSMQGAFTSVRFLTQVVPFMNARLQGLHKLGKSAKEDPQRFAIVLGAVAAVSLYLLAAYGDDDDWKRRDESDRNGFWWFKVGGVPFRIPKPFEVGAIATLAERGFELAFDKEMNNKRFRTQLLKLLGDNLSMNPTPQLIKPMLDVYSNINSFTDRPIESMGMERLKSEYRYNDRTSMVARGASTAMNAATGLLGKEALSPVEIDHMLHGYFGWLGSFVVGTADLLARPATGQATQATPDYWKMATGNMASDLRDAPSRYVSQMYEQAKEIERAYGTWRELQKQGKTQEAQEFRSEHLKELNQYHHVEAVKRQEALFNQQSRRIERSDMQPDMKRERLRAIGEQKHKLAKSLV